MIEGIVRAAVAHRKWVIGLWGLAAVALVAIAINLQLDALPDITSNQVQVLTRAPGLTPDEIEQRVTRPLETGFGGLPGLVETRSLSRYGLSAITLVFDEGVELLEARQLVAERMAGAAPDAGYGIEPPELGPMSGGLGEVLQFTVSSPTRTPAELLEMVELRVAPIMKTVSGLVEVNTWGGARRTFEVRADPARLAAYKISFHELQDALEEAIGQRAGASLESGGLQVLLRSSSNPQSTREIANLVVKVRGTTVVRVGDVASLAEGRVPPIGGATRNGQGETVYVMAQMLIGANAREVTKEARARLMEVQEVLPSDVSIDVVYDRSELVDSTLKTVGLSLTEGGLLVALVLFLMLGSARAGLIVAVTIVVAMLGATASMVVFGISGNLMSLGAVDFGLLVDGAVVVVEHVFHSAHDDKDAPWADRVAKACAAVARPSFFGVLVILLVYVPVLTLTGVDGKLFRPMALTVVLALSVALIFTLTFIPAAGAQFLTAADVPKKTPRLVRLVAWMQQATLTRSAAHPGLTAAVAAAALVAALVVGSKLGSELAPTLDEGSLVIQTERSPETSIEGAVSKSLTMEAAVRRIPEIKNIASRIGSPAVATDVMGLEQADVFVELKPKAQWRPGVNRQRLLDEMAAVIEDASPGADAAFTQPIQMRFNELLGGAPYDVVVSVLGQDLQALRQTAQRVLQAVKDIEGVEDPRILAEDEVPLIEVRPDPLKAGQRGLTSSDILAATSALRLGVEVGRTYVGPREVPVTLRLGAEAPHALGINTALLAGQNGELVTLEQVAEIRHATAPAALYRHDGERRLLLGFNVRGRELGEVVDEASTIVAGSVQRAEGTRLSWGGQFETLKAAQRRLGLVIPAVLALIGFVLFIHFRRLPPVLWVVANVPFAAVGGVFALASRGMALSISAAIGFIALWGIAVMNGTVLVTEIRRLESLGVDRVEATFEGAKTRTRPVSMTALVAALGFFPMALATGPGSEVQRPLATVVVGGLITSTLLTLVVLPSLRAAHLRWRAARA